jgi:hypothetical protein
MNGWFDNLKNSTIKSFSRAPIGSRSPSIGGDPEFFIVAPGSKIMNADRFLPGKEEPIILKNGREGRTSRIYFDGIQGEIAIAWDTCRDALVTVMSDCLRNLVGKIPKDHTLSMAPCVKVSKEIIKSADPEARRFGCMPDFNAYTLTVNTPEMDASKHPYRYAGGHLHLGISSPNTKCQKELHLLHEEGHIEIVRWLDLMISIPTFFLNNDESAKIRRTKYGKAGCFRPTPYGIEYRTPSAWWLRSPMTMSLIYGFARIAWEMATLSISSSKNAPTFKDLILSETEIKENDVRGALDEGDEKSISEIWNAIRPYVVLYGLGNRNPVSLGNVLGDQADVADFERDVEHLVKTHREKKEEVWNFSVNPVFSVAAFEYMLRNDTPRLIAKDPVTEWNLRSGSRAKRAYHPNHGMGFSVLAYKRLAGNKDFQKFQKSLMKEILPLHNIL